MPKIVTANLLSSGQVVFLSRNWTWVTALDAARIFADAAAAEDGLAAANRDVARAIVVEPFVTDAGDDYTGIGANAPAMSLRDTIRARGPTIDFLPAASAARG